VVQLWLSKAAIVYGSASRAEYCVSDSPWGPTMPPHVSSQP